MMVSSQRPLHRFAVPLPRDTGEDRQPRRKILPRLRGRWPEGTEGARPQ